MQRTTIITIALFLWSFAGPGLSQDSGNFNGAQINADTLEYYLLQAFNVSESEQRLPVNHLGLLASEDDQGYIVSAVLDGYPAQLAGLRRGDRLLTVNGSPFHPFSSFNSQADMDNRIHLDLSSHEIEYSRNGIVTLATVVPVYENLYDSYRTASLNSVQQISSGNKIIGYLKLWSTSRSTNDLITFKLLIDSLSRSDGIILDLRDSYGFIGAEHLDPFFPSRNSYFNFSGDDKNLWNPMQNPRQSDDYYDKSIVVIQNRGTRGGMELLSYQLSKLQRVLSLGDTTAGKLGRIRVSDSGNIIRYQAAEDIVIDDFISEGIGITPKQAVDFPFDQSNASDPQYAAAVMTLMGIM